MQLVDAERGRAHRAVGRDDGQRHDGLPGPAAEGVDVQRHPLGQVDDLRRHFREVVPAPPAEQGEPDPGEDPARRDATLVARPLGGQRHMGLVRGVPGQPQRDIRLDRGRDVTGPAVEGGPGAVLALLGADPPGRGRGDLLVLDTEELPQHQILGVHGHIRFEVAFPPSVRVLPCQKVVCGALHGTLRRRLGGSGWNRVRFRGAAGRRCPVGWRPWTAIGRRCHGFPFAVETSAVLGAAVGRHMRGTGDVERSTVVLYFSRTTTKSARPTSLR